MKRPEHQLRPFFLPHRDWSADSISSMRHAPPHASPRGFGLMQRLRDFSAYADLEAKYNHRRPSVWTEPQGDWDAG
jgi:glucan biosynthesis protein